MSPPLISEYKKLFTVKRVFQTLLGGPVLFAPALFLIVQVVIFLFPAVIMTLVQVIDLVQDPLWISCIVGCAILIMEILLNGLIIHLKRSSRVHTVPSTPSNHLAEEDHIYYRGLLHPSTWIFIAPNIQVGLHHLSAVICSTLSFALCTTLIIRKDTSILLRGFGLFSLCSARYSSVINFPPEIATFDAIRRKDFLYRPFYTFLIGFLFTIHSYFAEEVNYEWYAIALVTLPILWGFGILPPLDSFFPWIIELETCYSIAKGSFDSIRGIYWMFNLDALQRAAQEERVQFQELRKKPTKIRGVTKEEPRLLYRVAQCCVLNGVVFALSIITFKYLILPSLQIILALIFGYDSSNFWYWLRLLLIWTFDFLWVLPLFLLSRIVNALWFQDISNLAYRYSVGRAKGMPSLSNFIADNLFSLIIQLLFLLQAMVINHLPLWGVADLLSIFHMCLLYSLYSFEYKWVQQGWPLHQRLSFLETNWPYFLGFGLPLTLLTWWPHDIFISGAIFAIAFPIFIISGNEAEPIVNINNRRLQLFSLVVGISNALFNKSVSPRTQQQSQKNQNHPSSSSSASSASSSKVRSK